MGFFERYLTVWVLLCIAAGIALGKFAPEVAQALDGMSININGAPVISVPIALCLFFMMYPIMVKIDSAEVLKAGNAMPPVGLTLSINWAIKPFTMYAISAFFLGTVFIGFIGPDAVDLVLRGDHAVTRVHQRVEDQLQGLVVVLDLTRRDDLVDAGGRIGQDRVAVTDLLDQALGLGDAPVVARDVGDPRRRAVDHLNGIEGLAGRTRVFHRNLKRHIITAVVGTSDQRLSYFDPGAGRYLNR